MIAKHWTNRKLKGNIKAVLQFLAGIKIRKVLLHLLF